MALPWSHCNILGWVLMGGVSAGIDRPAQVGPQVDATENTLPMGCCVRSSETPSSRRPTSAAGPIIIFVKSALIRSSNGLLTGESICAGIPSCTCIVIYFRLIDVQCFPNNRALLPQAKKPVPCPAAIVRPMYDAPNPPIIQRSRQRQTRPSWRN